jgi:photosystem II stability/assembly factor-like uncharacterized protein
VVFDTASRAWAAGILGRVLRSENGGFNWSIHSPPVTGNDIVGLSAGSPTRRLAVGAQSTIARSNAAGTDWVMHRIHGDQRIQLNMTLFSTKAGETELRYDSVDEASQYSLAFRINVTPETFFLEAPGAPETLASGGGNGLGMPGAPFHEEARTGKRRRGG